MKKIITAMLAFSVLAICFLSGCKGAEGGKVSEKSTENMSDNMTNTVTETTTNNAVEQLMTDAATRIEEMGSNAESRAQDFVTDTQSAVSDLFGGNDGTNINS